MDRAAKKAKQRKKREQKRKELHKQSAISPHRVIETASRVERCYMNPDPGLGGYCTVLVVREARGLGLCMAGYLVDTLGMGLKDAWGWFGVTHKEVETTLEKAQTAHEGQIVEVPIERAAERVAGGIRYARQNGFRIPADAMKWLSFLPKLDVEAADLSVFGSENGKPLIVGDMDDIRRRMVAGTPEDLFSSGGSDHLAGVSGPDDEDEEDDEDWEEGLSDEESEAAMQDSMVDLARRIGGACAETLPANEKVRLVDLEVAAMAMLGGMGSALDIGNGDPDDPRLDQPPAEVLTEIAEDLVAGIPDKSERKRVKHAMKFVAAFLRGGGLEEMMKEVHMNQDGAELLPPIIESDGSASVESVMARMREDYQKKSRQTDE